MSLPQKDALDSKAKTLGEWIELREKNWINSDLTRKEVYDRENLKRLVLVEDVLKILIETNKV